MRFPKHLVLSTIFAVIGKSSILWTMPVSEDTNSLQNHFSMHAVSGSQMCSVVLCNDDSLISGTVIPKLLDVHASDTLNSPVIKRLPVGESVSVSRITEQNLCHRYYGDTWAHTCFWGQIPSGFVKIKSLKLYSHLLPTILKNYGRVTSKTLDIYDKEDRKKVGHNLVENRLVHLERHTRKPALCVQNNCFWFRIEGDGWIPAHNIEYNQNSFNLSISECNCEQNVTSTGLQYSTQATLVSAQPNGIQGSPTNCNPNPVATSSANGTTNTTQSFPAICNPNPVATSSANDSGNTVQSSTVTESIDTQSSTPCARHGITASENKLAYVFGTLMIIFCTILVINVFVSKRGMRQLSIDKKSGDVREIFDYELDGSNDKFLGTGKYGVVLETSLRIGNHNTTRRVAMKQLRRANAGENYFAAFRRELQVLAQAAQPHPNIVQLIGFHNVKDGNEISIVLELCTKGSLLNYLINCQQGSQLWMTAERNLSSSSIILIPIDQHYFTMVNNDDISTAAVDEPIPFWRLVKWCYEVSTGLEFLATLGVIHMDIAARNILLTDSYVAKVADFGLSRLVYRSLTSSDCYVKQTMEDLPKQSLAPESIKRLEFSPKSDVWAFGVLMWEIFSLGEEPYAGMDYKVLKLKLESGYRLAKPELCTEEIFKQTLKCWNNTPRRRPSISTLRKFLKKQLKLAESAAGNTTNSNNNSVESEDQTK